MHPKPDGVHAGSIVVTCPERGGTHLETSASDDRTFYWEWAKHEENLFTNRGNFFLVGESMLFAAAATLRSVDQPAAASALPIVLGLGIFASCIWITVNLLHHFHTRVPLQAKLNECEPRRAAIATTSGKSSLLVKSHFWIGVVMPAGILLAWIALIVR